MNSTELNDFKVILNNNGYQENDFDLDSIDLTQWDSGTVVPIKGSVTVRRKSTKKSKSYSTGNGTHWVVDFEVDLKQGFYN